jgi:hypothetical protein
LPRALAYMAPCRIHLDSLKVWILTVSLDSERVNSCERANLPRKTQTGRTQTQFFESRLAERCIHWALGLGFGIWILSSRRAKSRVGFQGPRVGRASSPRKSGSMQPGVWILASGFGIWDFVPARLARRPNGGRASRVHRRRCRDLATSLPQRGRSALPCEPCRCVLSPLALQDARSESQEWSAVRSWSKCR